MVPWYNAKPRRRWAVATPVATFGGEFVNGNKRTAVNAAITFVLINDWDLDFSEDELVGLALSVAYALQESRNTSRR